MGIRVQSGNSGTVLIALQEKLRSFLQTLRLRYAAIDLIESADDRLVFLEANPAGNWLWLEEKLGLSISTSIARSLVRGAPAEMA